MKKLKLFPEYKGKKRTDKFDTNELIKTTTGAVISIKMLELIK